VISRIKSAEIAIRTSISIVYKSPLKSSFMLIGHGCTTAVAYPQSGPGRGAQTVTIRQQPEIPAEFLRHERVRNSVLTPLWV
jgi:hypothetical protein